MLAAFSVAHSFVTRFIVCLLTVCAGPVHASLPLTLAQVAEQPQWLNLLQFRRTDWHRQLRSEVDDPAFFLAQQGKTDALAELRATLEQLARQPALQCRFPARAQWLHQQGLLKELRIGAADCPKLNAWLQGFDAESVSMIFPAAYLNSPSSMFGHLFLRIDQRQQTAANRLLAQTINFAANADHDDPELVFAYRGLFGGYPGVISVKPYYEKAREYSEIENRDIWEYQLDLSTAEIQRLLLHTWELQAVYFDYYFFDENCAYRILTLLDVARPSLRLSEQFYSYAIPSDTLRALTASNLVSEVRYRPSMATQLKHKVASLPKQHHKTARALAQPGTTLDLAQDTDVPVLEQAAILEVAFDYSRYRAQQQKLPREQVAEHSLNLLKQRSELSSQPAFSTVPEPLVRDDEGHKTFEVAVSQGNNDGIQTSRISIRPAYHDLMDPRPGYPAGAQIKFLETQIDYRETGTTRLANFTALNITSLTPRDAFFKPLSWRVDIGLYRKYLAQEDDPLTPTVSVGAGYSYELWGQQFYSLLEGQYQQQHRMPSNYAANLGVHAGWLAGYGNWQQHVSLRHYQNIAGYDHYYNQLDWQLSYHLQRDVSLFGKLELTHTEGDYFRAHQLGIEWRF